MQIKDLNEGERQQKFLDLLDRAKPGLTRFCWAMARDEDDARDLLAETIMEAWQAFPKLRDAQAFPKFCLTIARRTAASFWRRKQRFKPNDNSDIWMELIAETTPPDVRSDIQHLHAALKQLPRKQREAVVLFDLNGFNLKEIQDIQGGSLSGVKSRLRRGRSELATILGVASEEDTLPEPPTTRAAGRVVKQSLNIQSQKI